MNVSRKTMAVLLLLFVGFTAGTILVRMGEKKEAVQAPEVAYYLTAYDSGEDILAVVLENETGSLTIVHSDDTWLTDTQMPGIEPDIQETSQLFEAVSTIRMNSKVEGADPSDPQFGLDSPAATILVEDQSENGIQFLVGSMTPDGKAYYACASGGTEVFTLSESYGQAFLGDVTQYLDLRVLAGTDLSKVNAVSVVDAGGKEIRFSLAATGAGNVTGMKYYSLTEPVEIPMAASLTRENVFSPMEEMRAVKVTQGEIPDTEDLSTAGMILMLALEDGTTSAYTIGSEPDQSLTSVTDISTGVTYLVPSDQLTWIYADTAQLLGGKLLSLSAGTTEAITLEAAGGKVDYELAGSGTQLAVTANGEEMDAADFTTRILENLNRISVQTIQQGSSEKAEEVLRCTILTGKGVKTTQLVFEAVSDRKCHVSVNGKEAFECDRSSLQPLIEAAAGA